MIEDLRINLLKTNDLKILCLFSQNFISTDEIFNLLNISKELREELISKNKHIKEEIDDYEKEIKENNII